MQYGAVTDIRDLKEVPIGAEKCQGTGDDTMNSRKITCASFLFGGEHINKGKTHYGHAYASHQVASVGLSEGYKECHGTGE